MKPQMCPVFFRFLPVFGVSLRVTDSTHVTKVCAFRVGHADASALFAQAVHGAGYMANKMTVAVPAGPSEINRCRLPVRFERTRLTSTRPSWAGKSTRPSSYQRFKTIFSLTVQPTWMPVKILTFYVAEFTREFTKVERKWVSRFDIWSRNDFFYTETATLAA
jgi:hypothetical protein